MDLAAAAETVKLDINDTVFYSESRRLRNPRTLLRLCPSLITLIRRTEPSEPEHVTLPHASIREFLQSTNMYSSTIGLFHISSIAAPLNVAESCVAYMLHISDNVVVEDYHKALHASPLRVVLTPDRYWPTLRQYPLLEYARVSWDTHVRKTSGKETGRLQKLVFDYLSSELVCELATHFPSGNSNLSNIPPLLRMAELGLARNFESLIEAGHDVNSVTSNGWTAVAEKLEMVDLLLKRGASLRPPSALNTYDLAIQKVVGLKRKTDHLACESIALRLLKAGATLEPADSQKYQGYSLVLTSESSKQILSTLGIKFCKTSCDCSTWSPVNVQVNGAWCMTKPTKSIPDLCNLLQTDPRNPRRVRFSRS
ncbi:hypothetical protein CC86DRAFT_197971 [Ophiobolus disseminans]|uniref:Ankyrin n=1 Tax=Ophiobolus disseminans TaxID=1469910 RepID=A0A6A7A7J5_9PLEO|nr:hypothetical protein CC86DRAFT_197971 [Ophiobolus disseminans]